MQVESVWFVRHLTETLGPMGEETLIGLLKQRRVDFADFGWHEGLPDWTRLFGIQELASHMPPHPGIPVPGQPRGSRPAEWIPRETRAPLRGFMITQDGAKMEIVNISESGILIKSDILIPVGTELSFMIDSAVLPKGFAMKGRVARHAQSPIFRGFGIEFLALQDSQRKTIQEYVARQVKT